MAAESFFRRWATHKAKSRDSEALRKKHALQDKGSKGISSTLATEPRLTPTFDDVAQLTADSDYSLFVARGTDTAVRRAALKTLFSAPHFQAIDGLDVYIGDYTRHAPLTPAMLAALQHVRSLTAPKQSECEQPPEQAETLAVPPRTASASKAKEENSSLEQAAEQASHDNGGDGVDDRFENDGLDRPSTAGNRSPNGRKNGQM